MIDVELLKGPDTGKRIQVTQHQADSLARVGYLKVLKAEDEKPDPAPAPIEPLTESEQNPPDNKTGEAAPRTKRTYRRRDMVAEGK